MVWVERQEGSLCAAQRLLNKEFLMPVAANANVILTFTHYARHLAHGEGTAGGNQDKNLVQRGMPYSVEDRLFF